MKAATQAKRDAQWAPSASPAATLNARQLARRKRIVATALDLASRGGYEAVQMRDVAARSGVALGTLYRYFASKDQLLAQTWADWSHEIEAHMSRHPLRGETRAERITDFIRRATRALEREPKLASALLKSLLVPDAGAEEPRAEMSAVMARVVDDELRALAPDDRDGIRDILGQVWYANLLLWVNDRIPAERVYENMTTACRLLLAHREA
jgi:TetR/AcrR family transcriptional regulator, cholesterol catabolism regulator